MNLSDRLEHEATEGCKGYCRERRGCQASKVKAINPEALTWSSTTCSASQRDYVPLLLPLLHALQLFLVVLDEF